jgi:hypothetical protein
MECLNASIAVSEGKKKSESKGTQMICDLFRLQKVQL